MMVSYVGGGCACGGSCAAGRQQQSCGDCVQQEWCRGATGPMVQQSLRGAVQDRVMCDSLN